MFSIALSITIKVGFTPHHCPKYMNFHLQLFGHFNTIFMIGLYGTPMYDVRPLYFHYFPPTPHLERSYLVGITEIDFPALCTLTKHRPYDCSHVTYLTHMSSCEIIRDVRRRMFYSFVAFSLAMDGGYFFVVPN